MTRQNRHPEGSRELTASMSWPNYDRLRQIAEQRKTSCAAVLEEALERFFAVEDARTVAAKTSEGWQLP